MLAQQQRVPQEHLKLIVLTLVVIKDIRMIEV
jgi:hypothetical protein